MRTMIGLFASGLLIAYATGVSAWEGVKTIKGNGATKEESREVPAFDSVEISSAFETAVSVGPRASVVLECDENLLPVVRTEVKDGVLSVNYAEGYGIQSSKPQKLKIVTPALKSIAARGATKIIATVADCPSFRIAAEGSAMAKVEGLNSAKIDVKAEGASQVTLRGRGDRIDIRIDGTSKFMGSELTVETARVSMDGATHAEIQVTGAVQGDVNGASSLNVRGNPKGRKVSTSGVSTVAY